MGYLGRIRFVTIVFGRWVVAPPTVFPGFGLRWAMTAARCLSTAWRAILASPVDEGCTRVARGLAATACPVGNISNPSAATRHAIGPTLACERRREVQWCAVAGIERHYTRRESAACAADTVTGSA